MRVRLLTTGDQTVNAINQWAACLADALSLLGHEAYLAQWQPGRLWTSDPAANVVVIPYNPFMYGRRGFAPRLVWDIWAVRRLRPRPTLVLVVHEPYVPIQGPKSLLIGMWQRAQLLALMMLVDHRFASIEQWARRFTRIRPTQHLPAGSNLPDARLERDRVRGELDANGAFVVATLSTGHPSHLRSYVEATLDLLSERVSRELMFLRLGSGALELRVPARVRHVTPGFLTAAELGGHLAAADLLLVPFVDGVSTRRTSLMAGLCEGVCVLGTLGRLTDPTLASAGLELVEVGQPGQLATRGVELALDDERRARSARRGRELFEARFAWDAIALTLLEALQ